MRKVTSVLRNASIDRAVVYALSARAWGLLSSILMLFLILRFMTPEEQGYYYTFSAILAAQILIDLGMGVVATQFASHCMAHLSWGRHSRLTGEEAAKARLRSLVNIMVRWYGIAAIVIIVVLGPAGYLFFSKSNLVSPVHWQIPWAWLILAAACNIITQPLLAILEGCNRVEEVARLRLVQNIAGSITAWVTLLAGGGLLALPAWNSMLAIFAGLYLLKGHGTFLRDMLLVRNDAEQGVDWKTEIWPLQWRIAVSWISGYFIYQLFVPVLFRAQGPVEAGKMGLSLAVANALLALPLAWLNTKSPGFGALIARRDHAQLDSIFSHTLRVTLALLVFGGVVLIAANQILQHGYPRIGSRFLPFAPFAMLICATIFNYITIAQATYLRAHKKEPFLVLSIVSGLAISLSTVTTAGKFGALGVMTGYLACVGIIGLGWGTYIFVTKRREYKMV
ncbi:MAG: hypothetical protein PGN08_04610 [Sphingomonas taxi]